MPGTSLAQESNTSDSKDLSKLKVEELYATLCAQCHGKNLEGGMAPSFLDGEWKHGSSDSEIAQTILKGNIALGMTPWEGILTGDQVRSMVIFIREKERRALNEGISFPKPVPGRITKTQRASYKIETVVDEGHLKMPWAIAFLPDGEKLVTERSGRLRVINGDGSLHPNAVRGTPTVVEHGQGGLLEVAPHPHYAQNGWIYLGFADGWREKPPEAGGKEKVRALTKVVRGKIKDHAWVQEETIWKADERFYTSAGVHFGTRFVFDDGYLFFIVGERGAWQEAQDLSNPKGKIFRVHDDGRIPDDNPQFRGYDNVLPGIWSYGHRNPQGLDKDPRDGRLYSTEHGPRGGDELNLILPGHNYGWPVITWGMNYNGTPITSKTHADGMDQPILYWLPSIAACGLDFYSGDRFPGWKNDLLAGALKNQEVRRLRIADGGVAEQEVILKDLGRVRDVADGPDGFVYVLLNKPDSIVRLIPAE